VPELEAAGRSDGFAVERTEGVTALAGANLFKFAPALGERLADGFADRFT
jgi:hypothetical protein